VSYQKNLGNSSTGFKKFNKKVPIFLSMINYFKNKCF
jgi:hypothetical protein